MRRSANARVLKSVRPHHTLASRSTRDDPSPSTCGFRPSRRITLNVCAVRRIDQNCSTQVLGELVWNGTRKLSNLVDDAMLDQLIQAGQRLAPGTIT